MMESIEKLRELRDEAARKMVDNPRWVCARAEEIADEIEREIAERYMLLPVDADGVPIRMYDCISEEEFAPSGGHVVGFKLYEGQPDWLVNCGAWVFARKCRHVKPRTLEDILQCAGVSVAAIEDVAAEIRELMEVDE